MDTIKPVVIVVGATGRMARRQHLERSLKPIIEQGGLVVGETTIRPTVVLVGRNAETLEPLADELRLACSTDLRGMMELHASNLYRLLVDGTITGQHPANLELAAELGWNIYTEKPLAGDLATAVKMLRRARERKIFVSVVEDKRFLPGFAALHHLIHSGGLGEILHARLEFGYWVFPDAHSARGEADQRPAWNWDVNQGGGIDADMVAHWAYLFRELFGRIEAVNGINRQHILQRYHEGRPVPTNAPDGTYVNFHFARGLLAQTSTTWTRRPYHSGPVELEVTGSKGSAVAYLNKCFVQRSADAPLIRWDPETAKKTDFREGWKEHRAPQVPDNAFRHQMENVLGHLVLGAKVPLLGTMDNAVVAMEVVDAVRRSSKQRGAPIDIRHLGQILAAM